MLQSLRGHVTLTLLFKQFPDSRQVPGCTKIPDKGTQSQPVSQYEQHQFNGLTKFYLMHMFYLMHPQCIDTLAYAQRLTCILCCQALPSLHGPAYEDQISVHK